MYLLALVIIILFLSCTPKIKKELPPVSTAIPKISGTYLWAYKPTANVRENNSAKAKKIASIVDGDSVLVKKNINGWYEILLQNQQKGWIRSDLLGTINLSVFSKAVSFSDSLSDNFDIRIYFDKKLQHKSIFIEYPKQDYSSEKQIRQKTTDLLKKYQNEIYHGKITARVLKPESQDIYLTLNFKGKQNPDIKLPVIPFGILQDVKILGYTQITIEILVKENDKSEQFLKAARNMSTGFPLSFTRVQINFVSTNSECLFSFVEDSAGELYKFNQCL